MINIEANQDKNKRILTSIILICIAVTVGLNNIVIGYKVAGISIDRIMQIFIFIFIFKHFTKDLKDKNLKFVEIIILWFLILIIFNNFSLLIQNEDKITLMTFTRDTIRVFMYGIFTYLVYYLLKNDMKKLNIILLIQFSAVLLAFFQNPMTPLTDWSQQLKMNYFLVNMMQADQEWYNAFMDDTNYNFMRVSGPYGQVVTMSYTLVVSAILTTYMYLSTNKKIYIYFLLFLFLVSVMSLTRSAVGGIFIMLLFIAGKEKVYFIGLLALGIIYMLFFGDFDYSNLDNYTRVISTDDTSAQGKVPIWITGIATIIMYPFGITDMDYMSVKELMYSIYKNEDILRYPSHNGIINLGFQYTILGVFLFVYFIYRLCKMSNILTKKERKFWLFAFFAYLFQQSFHNNGIFYVEFNVLIILALYLVEINSKKIRGMEIQI